MPEQKVTRRRRPCAPPTSPKVEPCAAPASLGSPRSGTQWDDGLRARSVAGGDNTAGGLMCPRRASAASVIRCPPTDSHD